MSNEGSNSKMTFYLFLALFLLALVIISIVTFNDFVNYQNMKKEPIETIAKVKDMLRDEFGKAPTYSPELEYWTVDSVLITNVYERDDYGSLKKGDSVLIQYQKSKPRNIFIKDKNPLKKSVSAILIISAIITVMLAFRKRLFNYIKIMR